MDLRQLSYVVAVAELSSFTRAAERCFVVQSALSHQVARLESELGARLFHRTSRQVRLTAAGEAFLPAARQCLAAAERARSEVAAATGEVRGRLSVGVIPTVCAVDVPAALRFFHDRHPQVRITLVMGGSDDLVDKVATGVLDVAFLGLPIERVVTEVAHHLLAHDNHVVVMSATHPLAESEELSLHDLAGQVFVDFPPGTPGRAQVDQTFAAAGLSRDVAFDVTDAHLMTGLIGQELGIGMLPSAYAQQLTGVVTIPVRDAARRAEHLIWSSDGPSPAAAAFLDQVRTAAA
ncbi:MULTISPECIES: LysR family transcriptional regulator [unclassified Rhodococcus (in: high G+C Gram-positive bacteria)]|uniref:LysR family transcriptional regulator n=1 Tax=unclassified Rhodococcus (in: high G+C Gram-positive bacteria) TaxID=192944 RepID=UPI003399B4D4